MIIIVDMKIMTAAVCRADKASLAYTTAPAATTAIGALSNLL